MHRECMKGLQSIIAKRVHGKCMDGYVELWAEGYMESGRGMHGEYVEVCMEVCTENSWRVPLGCAEIVQGGVHREHSGVENVWRAVHSV